jgi:hypothetical protein
MCGISKLISECSKSHRGPIGRLPIARFRIFVGVTMACAATLILGIGPAQARDSWSSNARILERLDALERENNELRAEVRQQKEELQSVTQKVEATSQSQAAQVNQLDQKVTATSQEVPALQTQIVTLEKRQRKLPVQVGFRTGWSESPYDMPGGYFYGAYLSDKLLDEEDGVPGGYITGELMAGIVLGNNALTNANLLSQLLPVVGKPATPFKAYLDTIEIQPTVQYHLNLASVGLEQLSAFKPYALAGPGIWISTLSTPVVVGKFPVPGNVPGSGYRHSDADIQPGGVYGLGFELALSSLHAGLLQGIVNRTSVGAEWRFNELANGENFQQYTGSIAFGF